MEGELGKLMWEQKDQLGQSQQPQPKSDPSSVFVCAKNGFLLLNGCGEKEN